MSTFKHRHIITPRFIDMDAFGHINHVKFLTYCEEARIKYLDDLIDWSYGWSKTGIIMARAEIDYLLPAHFKDELIIYTRCSRLGTKSFTLEYRLVKITGGKEIILSNAQTVVVMYNYETNTSIPIPEEWRTALKNFDEIK